MEVGRRRTTDLRSIYVPWRRDLEGLLLGGYAQTEHPPDCSNPPLPPCMIYGFTDHGYAW